MFSKIKLIFYRLVISILCICMLNNIFIINRNVLAINEVQSKYGNDSSNLSYTETIAEQQSNNLSSLQTEMTYLAEIEKPQTSIILNELKINNISTKNYYNIYPNDEVEFTYKLTAEDILISDVNNNVQHEAILTDYEIKNMKFNLNIPENFEILPNETGFIKNGTVYTKSLENIKYKLNYDKSKYVAEPYYITFKLKSKSVGDINFGGNYEVTYNSIKNNLMKSSLPRIKLRVIENAVRVDLVSDKVVKYIDNSNININYKVIPEEFLYYEDIYGKPLAKDVFFLIDSSSIKTINSGNNIFNKIANDEILKFAKTRYSVITYGNNNEIQYVNELIKENREIQNEGVYAKYIEDVLSKANTSSTQGSTFNIIPALKKVEEISKDGRADKNLTQNIDSDRENTEKFIIIVGQNNISDINNISNESKILKDKGFNIITLNLGDIPIKDKWKTEGGYTNAEENEIEPNNNLKEVHYKLNNEIMSSNETLNDKINNNYFIKINYDKFDNDKKNITQMNQFFNQGDNFSLNCLNNQVSPKIAISLRGGFNDTLSISKPNFEFNLQGKCQMIGKPKYDDNTELNFTNDGNKVQFYIPEISYKYNGSTRRYELTLMTKQPMVTLTIKLNNTTKGDFEFSKGQSYFNYKDIVYGLDKKLQLYTPTIQFNTESPDLF